MAGTETVTGNPPAGATPPAGGQQQPPAGGASPPPQQQPGQQQQPPADDPVEKAYAKLRAAEAERDAANARVRQFEREKLPEAERVTAERDELKAENQRLKAAIADGEAERLVSRVAQGLGFHDPNAAKALLASTGFKDWESERKVETALTAYANNNPWVAGQVPPPPSGGPVGGPGQQPAGDQGMNWIIRRSAGYRT